MFALPKIYLASKSPRRRDLLKQIGVDFVPLLLREAPLRGSDINEAVLPGEAPIDYVQRIVKLKAEVGWDRVLQRRLPRMPLLAADTTVSLGDKIFGKPVTAEAARAMLQELSGQEHRVLTGVAVIFDQRCYAALNENIVRFREITEREIEAYVRSGEPMDKAGGYAVQGFAAGFIPEIKGSYSGVMGLPLHETVALLRKFAPH